MTLEPVYIDQSITIQEAYEKLKDVEVNQLPVLGLVKQSWV